MPALRKAAREQWNKLLHRGLRIDTPFGWISIFREKRGVISETELWIIIYEGWMYMAPTLAGVLKKFVLEYQEDQHLAF